MNSNYKIRVNSPAESERAQRAFFALGYAWGYDANIGVKTLKRGYPVIRANRSSNYISGRLSNWKDVQCEEIEVTLPELEEMAAKAAHGEGLNSFETMVQEKMNSFEIMSPGIYLRNGKHYNFEVGEYKIYGERICNDKGVVMKPIPSKDIMVLTPPTDNKTEAQKRYDDAVTYLQENAGSIVDDRDGYFRLEQHEEVKQALRIAAGLE